MAWCLRTGPVLESEVMINLQALSSLTSKGRDRQGQKDQEIPTEEFKAMLEERII